MKLTLRTLLAYLDDTLDTHEIKPIGEKVAESDHAQQLIERIKKVTRRRGLTNPPDAGPGAFDANDVAEYLDNVLPNERIVEIEKQCLESDVHLAEVATCHQVLTLVLGEPAIVPPKAKERMYRLVSGTESMPYKKAAPARVASGGVGDTDEEELVPGDAWLRWVLPAAGVLLLLVLGLTVWQLTRVPSPPPTAKKDGTTKDDSKKDDSKKDDDKKDPPKEEKKDPPKKEDDKKDPPKKEDDKKDNGPITPPKKEGPDVPRVAPPNKAQAVVGTYRGGLDDDTPAGLVTFADKDWTTVERNGRVLSGVPLVSLPGLISLVETRSGALLTLRGNVPALSVADQMLQLLESSIVLHQSEEFDVDLTLNRGRLYIRNNKPRGEGGKSAALNARVRFMGEVWDISLPRRGDEVGLDLIKFYTPDINYKAGEEPRAMLWMCITEGDADVKVDAYHSHHLEAELPRTMMMSWDSFRKVSPPQRFPQMPPAWRKQLPAPEDLPPQLRGQLTLFKVGLKTLEGLLKARPPRTVLREMVEEDNHIKRVLGVYSFAGLGDIDRLVDLLGSDDRQMFIVREQAVFMIRHWLAADPGNAMKLYDPKTNSGILRDREYKTSEASAIVELLFDFPQEGVTLAETLDALARYLAHPRVAIAQLAFHNIVWRARGAKLPEFNAAESRERRDAYARRIQEMIANKTLPAPVPEAMP